MPCPPCRRSTETLFSAPPTPRDIRRASRVAARTVFNVGPAIPGAFPSWRSISRRLPRGSSNSSTGRAGSAKAERDGCWSNGTLRVDARTSRYPVHGVALIRDSQDSRPAALS